MLHGRYPASSLVRASPTPGQSRPLVMYSLGPSGSGCPAPPCRVSQVPRLICSCALSPTTPEGPAGACSLLPPPIAGFITLGRLATSNSVTRPNRVRSLRLAGLLPRFPPTGLLRPAPVPLQARTSNLHGELLSVHKISQAYPGVPKPQRRVKPQHAMCLVGLRSKTSLER